MHRLHGFCRVLEDDFHEIMKCNIEYRSAKKCIAKWSSLGVLDGVETEDAGNVVVVRQLQWRWWIDIGDPIKSISSLVSYLC